MGGTLIISPAVLVIMLVVAVLGYLIMSRIMKHKWGYTKEHEKQLEDAVQNGEWNSSKRIK